MTKVTSGKCCHDVWKYYCVPYDGKGICKHEKRKMYCRECQICIHDKVKYRCKLCLQIPCAHNFIVILCPEYLK